MMIKKKSKFNLKQAIFGFFFAIMGSFTLGLLPAMTETVYADPSDAGQTSQTTMSGATEAVTGDACKKELGEIAWLVCPSTGKIAEATDWLYEKIEDVLVISPASMEDGSPIYEIWKYCRGITNVVFIIFLLVVVYSQITGLGINNYGIKKALPKLIIAAVLVNLSFYVCTLAVDLSNVIGNGLRGMFASVAESTMAGSVVTSVDQLEGAAWWDHQRYQVQMENTLYGGALLATFAGLSSLGSGAIWMLIPVVLGGIVAVASGLITIALRQAVVTILMMIAPLAMVAYMLPNTEQWFKKWKDLLFKMLVFYPMFSLLFGASNLAGFAIIRSAKEGDGFVVLLGTAVQIFPLFFSWSLMKMSGTFLGTINTKIRGLAAKPLATNRAWAESRRALAKQKRLASSSVLPSTRLAQYLSNRKIAREEESAEYATTIKKRGLAYAANKNYKENGVPTKEGMEAYERQARNMRYDEDVLRHKNNMAKGLGGLEVIKANATTAERAKLDKLDAMTVKAADDLKSEMARGAKIEYDNAKGFYDRALKAQYVHDDDEANKAGWKAKKHRMHNVTDLDRERYERMKNIMEGKDDDTQYIFADAAHTFHAHTQIMHNKFQTASDLTPQTQSIIDHLNNLVGSSDAAKNIDAIIGGLRILNKRGDTDKVAKLMARDLLGRLMSDGKIEGGTYASQAIANYSMFDVGSNDPMIRRVGKYINMQTAAMYDDVEADNEEELKNKLSEKRRYRKDISWWEYINSGYVKLDENGEVVKDDKGNVVIEPTRGYAELVSGTSYSGIERTGFQSQVEGIRAGSYDIDSDGNLTIFNPTRFEENEKRVWRSTMPNIITDHFSYLSGSEQVLALQKALFFIDPKTHKFNWDGVFGEEAKNLSWEFKKKYIEDVVKERVKDFYNGHVASHIARSKSDMLIGAKNFFALLASIEDDDGNVDIEKLMDLESGEFDRPDRKKEGKHGSYGDFEKKYFSDIKEKFQGSFKPDTLEIFKKMHKRGHSGDAKPLLFELLDLSVEDKNNPTENNERRERKLLEEKEKVNGPVAEDATVTVYSSSGYEHIRQSVDEVYAECRRSGMDVREYWGKVRGVLTSVDNDGWINDIEEIDKLIRDSQYTDIAQLYDDISDRFFDE